MNKSQASGIVRLVKAWEKYGNDDDNCLAYVLATSHHETGERMQPVRETNASSDEQAIARLETAWKAGKLTWVKTPYWRPDRAGMTWFGRGDVQLTHEANYKGTLRKLVLKEFRKDIHENPDYALDPDISAFILIEGMMRRDSLRPDFTAYALEDFVNTIRVDFVNARKAVNPGDAPSYAKIARTAKQFQAAIAVARKAPAQARPLVLADALPDATRTVEAVQRQLINLGYTEVGRPDGRMGRRTEAAILAFRNDVGLPLSTEIDKDLAQALLDGQPRPVSIERATATVDDINDKPAVKDALSMESIGKWVGIGGGTAAAGKSANEAGVFGMLDRASDVADRVSPHISTAEYLFDIVRGAWPFVAIAAVGGVVFYFGRRIIQRQIKQYREGKI